MKTYCVKCRKDKENIDPKMVRTKHNRLVMQSKCSVSGIKKSRFVKKNRKQKVIKLNEIVNRFLLVGYKVMPEMQLKNLVLLTVLVVHSHKTKKE